MTLHQTASIGQDSTDLPTEEAFASEGSLSAHLWRAHHGAEESAQAVRYVLDGSRDAEELTYAADVAATIQNNSTEGGPGREILARRPAGTRRERLAKRFSRTQIILNVWVIESP